ncbi:MAG: hypothetical protein HOP28_10105 [Gemmatimonadales bacterium]|nr:hypothetical protein [Gemmatimonadales bacterium]
MRLAAVTGAFFALLSVGNAAEAQRAVPAPPPMVLGTFEDDYGGQYGITPDAWQHGSKARYRIVAWRPERQYLIAQNDPNNPSEAGLWTRIDWLPLTGMPPYEWAFCMSAYKAASAAEAEATNIARRDTPRTGCNGFPFSRMKRVDCRATLAPRTPGGPQIADTAFAPPIRDPDYAPGAGPRVLLDEAHFNFHTIAGRYAPFAALLRRNGFVVEPLRARITAEALAGARVLVIANALAERNSGGANWVLPTPSAFNGEEIGVLTAWVRAGGSLLLIADHMPFPGAAEALAAAFGIRMHNGFATDATCAADEFVFRRSDGSLADHPITRGRNRGERIDSIRSFTGQAFEGSDGSRALLTLAAGSVLLLPHRAWQFADSTDLRPAGGMWQGAALLFGKGRVAVFGEAAMFSAQVSGAVRRPMGMNAPRAGQNPLFLLNTMRWLAGVLPAK